jgi:hypothetical protein
LLGIARKALQRAVGGMALSVVGMFIAFDTAAFAGGLFR